MRWLRSLSALRFERLVSRNASTACARSLRRLLFCAAMLRTSGSACGSTAPSDSSSSAEVSVERRPVRRRIIRTQIASKANTSNPPTRAFWIVLARKPSSRALPRCSARAPTVIATPRASIDMRR